MVEGHKHIVCVFGAPKTGKHTLVTSLESLHQGADVGAPTIEFRCNATPGRFTRPPPLLPLFREAHAVIILCDMSDPLCILDSRQYFETARRYGNALSIMFVGNKRSHEAFDVQLQSPAHRWFNLNAADPSSCGDVYSCLLKLLEIVAPAESKSSKPSGKKSPLEPSAESKSSKPSGKKSPFKRLFKTKEKKNPAPHKEKEKPAPHPPIDDVDDTCGMLDLDMASWSQFADKVKLLPLRSPLEQVPLHNAHSYFTSVASCLDVLPANTVKEIVLQKQDQDASVESIMKLIQQHSKSLTLISIKDCLKDVPCLIPSILDLDLPCLVHVAHVVSLSKHIGGTWIVTKMNAIHRTLEHPVGDSWVTLEGIGMHTPWKRLPQSILNFTGLLSLSVLAHACEPLLKANAHCLEHLRLEKCSGANARDRGEAKQPDLRPMTALKTVCVWSMWKEHFDLRLFPCTLDELEFEIGQRPYPFTDQQLTQLGDISRTVVLNCWGPAPTDKQIAQIFAGARCETVISTGTLKRTFNK